MLNINCHHQNKEDCTCNHPDAATPECVKGSDCPMSDRPCDQIEVCDECGYTECDCPENQVYESCPKCGRFYDDIDYDFQSCSKCGWDNEKQAFGETREPDESDYEMGDADLLTGRWW